MISLRTAAHPLRPAVLLFASLLALTLSPGCGGSAAAASSSSTTTTSTTTTTTTETPNAYTAVYKSMTWGSTVAVTFPSTCSMIDLVTGKASRITRFPATPTVRAPTPPSAMGQTVVATRLAVLNTALMVISYATTIAPTLRGSSATIDICPTAASSTTATSLGAIGYLISGTAMFNPYEMDAATAAVNDNASYTFTDSNNVQQTAYFLDQCDSHSNGSTWHAHGNPSCVTAQVDTATGPSHIIGIALDGFPIYGGRDMNGAVVDVSTLDACNGITSPTPEFPSGAYHYVLPIGVTTSQVSINCYRGAVSGTTMAAARKLACNMKMMFANATAVPIGPGRKEVATHTKPAMAQMTMPDGSKMDMGAM